MAGAIPKGMIDARSAMPGSYSTDEKTMDYAATGESLGIDFFHEIMSRCRPLIDLD
jgi:hypothetical protein